MSQSVVFHKGAKHFTSVTLGDPIVSTMSDWIAPVGRNFSLRDITSFEAEKEKQSDIIIH
jgi:hypothetical protein